MCPRLLAHQAVAFIDVVLTRPLEGHRRLNIMLDADVLAVSPSSVYRELLDGHVAQARMLHRGVGFRLGAVPEHRSVRDG